LKELKELISSFQGLRDNEARGPAIVNSIVSTAYTVNLDKDIDLPNMETYSAANDTPKAVTLSSESLLSDHDREPSPPCGLHTVGVPPTAEEAIATLVNIAQLDRPEDKIEGLPCVIALYRP
jgi:magnesium chelatase subunit H